MTAKPCADQQPKDGDTIMHCGHLDRGRMYWFQYEQPMKFERPDGTRGEGEWFAACQPCVTKHGEDVTKFVRGDERWTSDAPAIEKAEEN